MNKKELIKFLQEKESPGNWLEIANKFDVYGSNKQKSDYVRRQWKKVKSESINFVQVYDPNYVQPTYILTTASSDPEYQEFLEFKKSKQKKDGFHIVIGCQHVPFHNKVLLNKLFQFIEDHKENILGFHLIGDFLDMKSLSSHDTKVADLSGLTLGKEYQEGNRVLDLYDKHLPEGIQKTFIYGNHEDRYFRYIKDIKNYKTADAIQSPEQALNLKERGYNIFSNWKEDFTKVGKYQLFHGVFCTVNPSKSHVDKLRQNCMFAHTHRINQHYEGWLHGLNIGCFADLQSNAFSYLSRLEKSNWKNGFGIINVSGNQSQAEVIVCENNGFFFNGKKY